MSKIRSKSNPETALEVHRGPDAAQLVSSPHFQETWLRLYENCPWSQYAQLPSFVSAWYSFYQDLYEPLVISELSGDNELQGLLTLAKEKSTGKLTFAGAHQAEYHTWLALPGPQTFIGRALAELQAMRFASLHFHYVPPGTPLEWLTAQWGRRSLLRPIPRPVMEIGDGESIRASLRKKNNRNRIIKLEKGGKLELRQLRTQAELDSYADVIRVFTDFRQGAANGSYPFQGDVRKYPFHRELMKYPDLLHVTILLCGDEVIAAHIGFHSHQYVILGIISHSPFVGQHSPGMLLLRYLGLLLSEQGIPAIDLTPSGTYKDRFATREDEAHLLTIFFSEKTWLRYRIKAAAVAAVKRVIATPGRSAGDVRSMLNSAGNVVGRFGHPGAAGAVFRRVKHMLWSTTEMRFYRLAAGSVPACATESLMNINSLSDLLCYVRSERWQPSKQEFLHSAMERIESGSRVYTHVEAGRLVHYGWLSLGVSKSVVSEVQQEYEFPPNSHNLWDFYTDPQYRGRGYYSRSLRQMMRDAATIPGTDFVYISVLAANGPSRRVIEKAAFEYVGSIIRQIRFFFTKQQC